MAEDLSIAYIIGTYPLLTTTFIDREIALLRRRGVKLAILSIRRPTGDLSAEQLLLQEDVTYLLPVTPARLIRAHVTFMLRRPRVMLRTLLYLLTRPHPGFKVRLKTLLHFGEGVYAAHLLQQEEADRLHAHFVDRAATVALVAGRLLDLPYSATAHANDIYVQPILLAEKIAEASFVATCTGYNQSHLANIAAERSANGVGNAEGASRKVHRIYHGLDTQRYTPSGSRPIDGRPRILAVGQLKEKKGFRHLLGACRLLKEQGYDFDCLIVGRGPLRNALQAQIEREDLGGIATLCGALSHDEVIEQFRQATVFALPCVLGADGDRDGIPNVILEAMALELPVVSTAHSGIPEVIVDGSNGLLVAPGDEVGLARALGQLLDRADLRQELGKAARVTVKEKFSVEANVDQLLEEFLA